MIKTSYKIIMACIQTSNITFNHLTKWIKINIYKGKILFTHQLWNGKSHNINFEKLSPAKKQ